MVQPFNGADDTTYTGTNTTQNGHTGAWSSGYNSDKWSGNVLVAGRESITSNTDDLGGTYGNPPDPIDDHLTYGGREWRDLSLYARTYIGPGTSQDALGLVFRWVDNENFYLVYSTADGAPAPGTGGNRTSPGTYLYRVRAGSAKELVSSPTIYAPGVWGALGVDANGPVIRVSLDLTGNGDFLDAGEVLFTYDDAAGPPLATVGRVGAYCYDSGADVCAFDDFTVTIDDADVDVDTVPDARDNCPTYANVSQADANGNRIGDVCEDDDKDGYTEAQGDCDDTKSTIHPGAVEACDTADTDCDADLVDGFPNADGDKNPDCIDADDDNDGVADGSDCKPLDASIYPGATETCDSIDSDCDTDLIDGFTNTDADKSPDCVDTDDDGDGVVDGADCRPLDKTVYPGAVEVCDLVDADCDGDFIDGFPNTDADTQPDCIDADDDGDGAVDLADCKPLDNSVYPGATEVCDAVDQDCDGNLVEGFPNTDGDTQPDCADTDDDNDTYADAADCGPLDKSIHPGATESPCDAIDSDCDGDITDGLAGDYDKDGQADCTDTDDDNDASTDDLDCNDFNAAVYPGATESCDAVDSDCDGGIVDGFLDTDADLSPDCVDPDDDNDGALDTLDCATLNPSIYPGHVEACDLIDSNCDKSLIDGFPNFDGDTQPDCVDADDDNDSSSDTADCNDANNKIYPLAPESCDTIDSDCDGELLDGFTDSDLDKTADCIDPDDDNDTETDAADCAPLNPNVNHLATEVCNFVDDDCSGVVDDSYASGAVTWYADTDGDQHGDVRSFVDACAIPSGYAAASDDCDDTRAYVSPDANESCNDFDDDCDGFADDEDPEGTPPDAPPWFADNDGDLAGDAANITFACRQPDYTTTENDANDCDDTNPDANPGAREVCNNGIDDNCNGVIDDDADDASWWPDTDLDGFGDASTTATVDCAPPDVDWVTNADDCDDTDDNIQPDATEQPGNGVDDDCDAATSDEVDTADTGDTDTGVVDTDSGSDTSVTDADGDGTNASEDCDDDDATIHPGAEELVDEVDQDCDGLVDPTLQVQLRGCGCETADFVGTWTFAGLMALFVPLRRRVAR